MGKLAKLRVVDDHATNIMSGYRRRELVGVNKIFPIINVASESGKFMEFGADQHVIRQGLERALGDERKRIDVRIGSGAFSAEEISLEIPIYDREIKNVPESRRDKYRDKKIETVAGVHQLAMEYGVAAILQDPAKYDANFTEALAGVNQWKDAGSKPYTDLRRWLRIVSGGMGIPVNELSVAFGALPWSALQDHANTTSRLAPTGREATPEVVANILGCKSADPLYGQYASTFDPDDPKNVVFSYIFGDVVIVYHEVEDPGVGDPLWGGVARVEGYPSGTEYRDEPRSADIIASDDNYGIFQQSNKRGFLARTVSGLTA